MMLRRFGRIRWLHAALQQQRLLATATQGPVRGSATTGNKESDPLTSSTADRIQHASDNSLLKPPQHPMVLLSYVFQHHPSALRLHRELTIALASGDAARAADLASVLANTVQRVTPAPQSSPVSSSNSTDEKMSLLDTMPAPTPDDVEEAVEKTREALLRHAAESPSDKDEPQQVESLGAASKQKAQALPFWHDPQCLCVTVLESVFETDVLDGEAQDSLSAAGNRAAENEAEQVRILETYLEKEGDRWKAQKAAIAKIVLDVARALQVTPKDLQVTEGLAESNSMPCEGTEMGKCGCSDARGKRLNVLRHSNLVIRGEIPATAAVVSSSGWGKSINVNAQLTALEERMRSLGTPLTHEEVQMARYELQMSQSKVRYVVGVHKELQWALDNSEAVKKVLQKRVADANSSSTNNTAASFPALTTGTQLFMDEVIRALNEGAEAFSAKATEERRPLTMVDVRAREAAENPVLPFTFMLKCCLWFDTTSPS